MVRTGNVDFSCKRLTSIEIRKSKYRIIRRVRRPPPPPPLPHPPPPTPEKDIWIRAWEKKKLLVTSNFFFSHSVFKRLVLQTHKNQGLFGKGLKNCYLLNKDNFVYNAL